MDAVGAGEFGQRSRTVDEQTGPRGADRRQKPPRQHGLLVLGQVLFAQTDPAAAGTDRGRHDGGKWPPHLAAVRHQ